MLQINISVSMAFAGLLVFATTLKAQDATVHVPADYGNIPVNYVRTWEAEVPISDPAAIISKPLREVKMKTQYFDGLGRPLQTVVRQGSLVTGGNPLDMVTAQVYDYRGREERRYLPFAAANSSGNFKLNPFEQQKAFYSDPNGVLKNQGENYFYSKTEFESSPLSRPDRFYAPGDNWVHRGHGTTTMYWNNTLADAVRIWTVTDITGGFSIFSSSAIYPAGELQKNIVEDERRNQVIEFMNKDGQLILKKVQLGPSAKDADGSGKDHTGWLCTYYIYDDFNRLIAVLQPKAVEELANPGVNWQIRPDVLNELCFRYAYDADGRMVLKKMPGAQHINMIYDQRDRLVMTQDGNMRITGTWLFTWYDELNRPTSTGLLKSRHGAAYHQAHADASMGYPFFSPLSGVTLSEILTENHYDNYNDLPAGLSSSLNASGYSVFLDAPASEYPEPLIAGSSVTGMVTWTKTKILGTNDYISSVNIYDGKRRLIQVQTLNQTGALNVTTNQYSFSGRLLRSHTTQTKRGSTPIQIGTKYILDDLGRVTKLEKNLNSEGWKTLSETQYDALGQLSTKRIGTKPGTTSSAVETLTYDYNIRGWLLGVNKSDMLSSNGSSSRMFGFELGYDKASNVAGNNFAHVQLNGNISGIIWKSAGDGIRRKYDFSYDNINRFMKGDFVQDNGGSWDNRQVNFDVRMGDGIDPATAYDANGNIKRMQQWGLKGAAIEQIDDLRYTYELNGTGNKLKSVVDFKDDINTQLGDFKTRSSHPQKSDKTAYVSSGSGDINSIEDYTYDVNGNMSLDKNKAIGAIIYNHLNLPQTITVTGKGRITYSYDAAGNKLNKITLDNSVAGKSITTTTTYLGSAVYESKEYSNPNPDEISYTDVLQYISHEEGRIRFEKALATCTAPLANRHYYDYFLKDHLGNVRMVLTEQQEDKCYIPASVEDTRYQTEDEIYDIDNSRRIDRVYTGATQESFENKLYRTHGNIAGQKTGLGAVLKVMSGDQVKIYAESYYELVSGDAGHHLNMALNELLSAFTGSGAVTALKGSITNAQVEGIGGNSTNLQRFITRTPSNNQAKAYLNWVLFDEQLQYVASDAAPVKENGGYLLLDKFINTPVNVTRNGYLYVFVSNESNLPVYFDNLTITHTNGPILEETHYYPFGLTMSGISSKAMGKLENKKSKFQAQEFNDDLGVDYYEFKWRNHDPQIGRFIQIDPLSDKYVYNSTYAFSENKVTNHVEIEGLESISANVASHYKEYVARHGVNFSAATTNGMINDPLITPKQVSNLERGESSSEKAGVVLHRTVSSSASSTLNSFESRGVGTHFLVGTDGTIYQTASLDQKTSHLRESQVNNPNLSNANTIGIEVVGNYNADTKQWDPVTNEQAQSVAFLTNSLITTYGLTNDNIYNHEDIQPKTAGEGRTVYNAIQGYLNQKNNSTTETNQESTTTSSQNTNQTPVDPSTRRRGF